VPTYRVTIERGVRFELDIEAAERMEVLKIITEAALHYDGQDLKETRVVAIKELKQIPVFDSLD